LSAKTSAPSASSSRGATTDPAQLIALADNYRTLFNQPGEADLLNALAGGPHARFLAFRHPKAQAWCAQLMASDCITDVRGDVLRIGLAIYHDASDIARCAALAARLG